MHASKPLVAGHMATYFWRLPRSALPCFLYADLQGCAMCGNVGTCSQAHFHKKVLAGTFSKKDADEIIAKLIDQYIICGTISCG